MKLGLVEGVDPHKKDAEIVKAIAEALREHGGGNDSIIAVKNEAGKVYRRFVINGFQQEICLCEQLEALGLVDETEQGGRKPKDIWAVYGAGRDMSLAGILAELAASKQRRSSKKEIKNVE